MTDYISEFRSAMAEAGLVYAGEIIADKRIHRFTPEGGKDDPCWYQLHPDGLPAGVFGDWRRGDWKQTWHQKNGKKLSNEDYAACQKKWKEAEEQRKKEEQERWARMSEKATLLVSKMVPADASHLYLETKNVEAVPGLLRDNEGSLVLPLRDITGKVWSYQTIDRLGDKLFMPGGKVRGCFFQIGKPEDGPIVICEGYATGATIHKATKWPVFCAMNCGNLQDVCSAARTAFPEKTIVVAGDNDRFTKTGNPGVEKAEAAAKACKGVVIIPDFPESSKGTDFNDLMEECGEGVVRSQLHAPLGIGMGTRISLKDLFHFRPDQDKDSIIGNRYLCRGGSCVIVAQTSAGKSSLGMQMAVVFALGLDFFGLKPRKPLKSVIVQAENDLGDTAEMLQGVVAGLGLITGDEEADKHVFAVLEKNLIIIRDQTHTGSSFSEYASKLVEFHKPDLFWIDPMLSFYGDDINDQKAMSQFLRAELNPVSERTGVIWMLLHHTGKPGKDAAKSQKNWSSRDFSYMGIGSSELSNWARAIICLTASGEDEFRMIFAKRGMRAGVTVGNIPTTELHLAYSTDHICWRHIPKPKEMDEMEEPIAVFARKLSSPMTATQIVKKAAEELQRGVRTCWKLWDSGEGKLGSLFRPDGNGKFVLKSTPPNQSYDKD